MTQLEQIRFATVSWLEGYAPTLVPLTCALLALIVLKRRFATRGWLKSGLWVLVGIYVISVLAVNLTWYALSFVSPQVAGGWVIATGDAVIISNVRMKTSNIHHTWCSEWLFSPYDGATQLCNTEGDAALCENATYDPSLPVNGIACLTPHIPT